MIKMYLQKYFLNHLKQTKLEGLNKIVEITELNFGKKKYYRRHHFKEQWVFGKYKRSTGRVFIVSVDFKFLYLIFKVLFYEIFDNII